MYTSEKYWYIPQPSSDLSRKPTFERVSQVKFYNEYFPSSHRIFDPTWYQDLGMYDKNKKFLGLYRVNRVSVPIQMMAVDIILAHLLGNKTYLVDGTLKENAALPLYKEYWEDINMDTGRYDLIRGVLALADGAILFYKEDKKLKWQVLSMFTNDVFNMEYDKYGKPLKFYKFYDNKCDVYDKQSCTTYKIGETWTKVTQELHGFNGIPAVYRKRESGSLTTRAQSNIDNMEVMLSRLSEDNRKKFKSLYHLKTRDPQSVKTESSGLTDMIVTDQDGDFKLISGADMSEQFKFEFDTQMKLIFNSLGIVFPEHKSSGDMPTGSMKMMFYPTERVVMSLIHEFDSMIDEMNEIVKQGFVMEYPNQLELITKGNIRASIKMFTPQDDASKVDSLVKLREKKAISSETIADEAPYAANNEQIRLKNEQKSDMEEEIELERRKADLRLI